MAPKFTTRIEKVEDPDGGPPTGYMVLDVNGKPYMRTLFGNAPRANYSLTRLSLIADAEYRLAKFPEEMPR